jgi:DNA-binding response OmpR family regulator
VNRRLIFFQIPPALVNAFSKYSHFSITILDGWFRRRGNDIVKLLVVEDEKRMVELLHKGLTEEGHTVACATDGTSGFELAANYDFDVIILDIMLPKLNGYEVAKRLRSENIATRVLMLTAKDTVQDVVHGLDLGADDYMTKPFSFQELLARLRAVKRRPRVPPPLQFQVGDLALDPATREVSRDGVRILLTRTEYSLLEHLIYRAGTVVRRQSLIEAVWGFDREIEDNTLDVFIRLLRKKIEDGARQKLIHTVRGVGYVLRATSF